MADAAISALLDGAQDAYIRKVCIICGEALLSKQGRFKFCSRACGRVEENRKRTETRRNNGVSVIIGAIFPCKSCGVGVIAKSPKSRYCDDCRVASRKETFKKHVNSDKAKSRTRQRLKSDKKYAINRRMGWAIWHSLKSRKSGRKWETIVGYTLEDLCTHVERQFMPGMTWDNMGEWHIDHIRPRSEFSYDDETSDEFKACWALTNLRPLWAKENISKGGKRTLLL